MPSWRLARLISVQLFVTDGGLRLRVRFMTTVWLGALLGAVPTCVFSQVSVTDPTTLSGSAATVAVRNVQGRVTNALDGTPVPRVLVNLNARAVLTDPQGKFSFPEFSDSQAYVSLTKPGFSQTARSGMMGRQQQRVTNLDVPLELKIYPDAVITGTVTARDGLPLGQVQVQLRREMVGPQGMQAQMLAVAMTNSRGEYRFRQPAGRYQVSVAFVMKARETGDIFLPETFPQSSAGDRLAFFDAASGEEEHIDLRPRGGVGYPVQVRVDSPDAQRGLQFTAVTSTGEVFNVRSSSRSLRGRLR